MYVCMYVCIYIYIYIYIYISGKVTLMLGAVPFTISEAARSNVLHQV